MDEVLSEELLHTEPLKTGVASHNGAKQDLVELQFYRLITDNSLECCFPNVGNALRIYWSLMVTNCNGEHSFSKLKGINSTLRSVVGQNRPKISL